MRARGLITVLVLVVLVLAGTVGDASDARADGGKRSRQWERIWRDSFSGPANSMPNPRRWRLDIGGWGWGSGQHQTYTSDPANVSLDGNGHLVITARNQTHTGPDGFTRPYTSGRLKTEGLFAFRYGRIAARVKVPSGQGLWSTFWMLGNDIRRVGFPECGEVDVMELLGQEPHLLHGSLHGPGRGGQFAPTAVLDAGESLATRFHTYEVRWSRRSVRFRFDGQRYGVVRRQDFPRSAEWVYDHRFYILLNLAVGGGWAGSPDASTPFPATMKVDWVRVFKPRR